MAQEMAEKAFWNGRYDGDDYLFGTEPNAFLARQAPLLNPGMRALALADGEGRNSVWLARQGLEVVATDISDAALAKARKLAASHGVDVDYVEADLLDWQWPEATFDAVVAIFIQVFDPQQRARVFANIKQTLKPGGLLMLEGYRPEQLDYGTGGPPVLDHLYTEQMLRDGFADFELLTLESYDPVLSEGARHSGKSAVIDLVARKPG